MTAATHDDLTPASPSQARAARLSIASYTLFVLLLGSLHLLEPDFDPTWRFISEYALGAFGWLMHLAFFLLATSLVSAGVALLPYVRTVVGFLGLAILGLSALGLFLAAIFRTDPIATSQAAATWSGTLHVLGASLDWTPLAALLLSVALARTPAWRPVRRWLYLTTGVTWLTTIAFMLQLPHDGMFGPGVLAGLFGRFVMVSYLGWLVVVGFHTLKLQRQGEPPRASAATAVHVPEGRA